MLMKKCHVKREFLVCGTAGLESWRNTPPEMPRGMSVVLERTLVDLAYTGLNLSAQCITNHRRDDSNHFVGACRCVREWWPKTQPVSRGPGSSAVRGRVWATPVRRRDLFGFFQKKMTNKPIKATNYSKSTTDFGTCQWKEPFLRRSKWYRGGRKLTRS